MNLNLPETWHSMSTVRPLCFPFGIISYTLVFDQGIAHLTPNDSSRERFHDPRLYSDDILPGFNDALYLVRPWLPITGIGAFRMRSPRRIDFQHEATPLN